MSHIKAYAITIKNNNISEGGFHELVSSSKGVGNDFDIHRFDAVIPTQVQSMMKEYGLQWNYPDVGSTLDPWTGMRKTAYGGLDPLKRVACSLSHYLLWKMCAEADESILILEHDSLFVKKLDLQSLEDSKFGIVGINSPIHATFSFKLYDSIIQQRDDLIQPVPMLTSKEIPQGLPGNSAYFVKPHAARHLIELCHKYGLWPNDAIMCRQLCDFLGVSKTYYTRVQGLKSTTTL